MSGKYEDKYLERLITAMSNLTTCAQDLTDHLQSVGPDIQQ